MAAQYFIRFEKSKTRIRLLMRTGRGTDRDTYTTVNDDRIDGLNNLLAAHVITPSEARKKGLLIAAEYRAKETPSQTLSNANEAILTRYWAKRGGLKDLKDPDAAYNRLWRALKALGDLDLSVATSEQLKDALSKKLPNRTTQRDAVAALRQLLKFIGRPDVYLPKPRRAANDVYHVSLKQFKELVETVEDETERLVLWCAMGTGARQGEIWGIEKTESQGKAVWIEEQLTRTMSRQSTKREGKRWAYIIPEARPFVRQWIDLEDRDKLRKRRWADIVAGACVRAEVEPITFHDLRHSYAIYLLQRGFSMEKVARWLGNSITVCEQYYTGYVGTLADLEGVS